MEEVQYQFFASIEMIRENNSRARAVGAAHPRPRLQRCDGGTGDPGGPRPPAARAGGDQADARILGVTRAANAAAIKRHTTEIGDVYNSPVIAIDKITQATQRPGGGR